MGIAFYLPAQQYNFKPLTVQDGLAQSQVYSILQDSRGYVWMGTRGGGVSRYDGSVFTSFTTKNGLADNYIHRIFEDEEDILWFGTSKGLSRYNGLEFQNFEPSPGLDIGVEAVAQDKEGTMWIGTDVGLFTLQGDTLERFKSEERWEFDSIYDLVVDTNGTVWGCTDYGIFAIQNSQITSYSREDGLSSNLVNDLYVDQNNLLWISTYGSGVNYFDGESFESVIQLSNDVVFCIEEFEDQIWFGTLNNGIAAFNPRTKTVSWRNDESGLINNQVRALESDEWGNMWIGTGGGGAALYSGQSIRFLNRDNGLPGRRVYSVAQDALGTYWVGLDDQYIARLHPDSNDLFFGDLIDLDAKVKVLQTDNQSRLWAGTEGQGITIFESDTTYQVNRYSGLASNYIKGILPHENGNVYVASTDGINILTEKRKGQFDVDLINMSDGLSENRIVDLCTDQFGRVWFATSASGIGVLLPDNTVLNFGKGDNPGLVSNAIRSLSIDQHNWLWIGTAGDGISRMDLNADTLQIAPLAFEQGLDSDNIYFIEFDVDQHAWIGTESGVDRMLLNDEREPIELVHYGKDEGLLGIETCTNASFVDDQCQLWFGTIDGLAMTDPGMRFSNNHPPKTRITQVNLFYKSLEETHLKPFLTDWKQIKDSLVLTYEQNHLSFEFVGIDMLSPAKVRYRWMLEGNEEEWSPLTSQTNATYSNLKPGAYTFKVQACNEDLVFGEEKFVRFVILAPFWQKTWFIVACILAGILAIALIFLLRVQSIKKNAREKSERLELEKGMMELEQKALRLQMNPHFIFNTLNTIQSLIATRDAKTARLYLSKFSKLMRETLENSREGLISVEDEASALKHYLDLEKFSHDELFNYTIEINELAHEYMLPPLLVQPFAENAIIHGLTPNGTGGHLAIRFIGKEEHLLIEIEDNGIGRKKAAELKAQRANYHKSTGLQVTQERLDLINGIGSDSITFVDLGSPSNPAGTRVELIIRLNEV